MFEKKPKLCMFEKNPIMPPFHPKVDSDLLRRLQEGDEAAFGAIYRLFAPVLYQRLVRLLKDIGATEEILQDVFLKLWEKRAQIDPERGFRTYLYRIADNLAIDFFRKITREKALQEELWVSGVYFYLQTEEELISKEERQLITNAISELPPKRRRIVILCKLEGKSYQDVADLMGISVSTVSNQLVKAIKEIKNYVVRSAPGEFIVILLLSVLNT